MTTPLRLTIWSVAWTLRPPASLSAARRANRRWSETHSGRSAPAEYHYQSMRSRFAIMRRAFGWSRPRVFAQLLLWLLFQAVSEAAALRRELNDTLPAAWRGRLRGLASCVRWEPPTPRLIERLLPRSAT